MEVLEQRPEILKVVEKISSQKNFKNYRVTDVKTNAKGEGYLGEIFLVYIKDEESGRELNIAIKAAFTNNKIRDMAPIRQSFENEVLYYSTIYPAFQAFWKSRGIKRDLQFAPECLYYTLNEEPEVLVLENLKSASFEIFDKKRALDRNHTMLIFKNYGRYHALSMAFLEKNPEKSKELIGQINQHIFMDFFAKDHLAQYFVDTALQAQKALQPGEDDDLLKAFEKYTSVDSLYQMWKSALDSDCDYPAILHGDCWSNNMLFKYENSKPIDMRLIDFQLIKVGNPVCDLSYFFYSGTSKEGLLNFNEYLEEYHKSFSETARELGSNPEKLFPFEGLKKSWIRHAKFGFVMTFNILKMKMTDQAEMIDMTDVVNAKNEEAFTESFKNLKFNETEYNDRMREIIQHMYDLEAL